MVNGICKDCEWRFECDRKNHYLVNSHLKTCGKYTKEKYTWEYSEYLREISEGK